MLGFFNDCHRDDIVGGLLHHLVVQDEPVLVFDYAGPQSKLHRNPGLAFGDPLRVRLEQGEDLLLVRNALTLQDPAVNLIDLTLGVLHELVEFLKEDFGQNDVLELLSRLPRALQVDLGLLQIDAVRLAHLGKLFFALVLVFGCRVLELLCVPVELLELPQVKDALAPIGQAVGLAQIGRYLDGLANGIPEKVDVSRVVNVRLHDKGVNASGECEFLLRGPFFTNTCPAPTTS